MIDREWLSDEEIDELAEYHGLDSFVYLPFARATEKAVAQKAAEAERAAIDELRNHDDVLAPVGNSAWGEAYQDGWIAGVAAPQKPSALAALEGRDDSQRSPRLH